MRTKLTALLIACAALAASAATAGAAGTPVPVAVYTFQAMDDVNAFQKVTGTSCKRKWANNQAMAITVGNNTNSCVYRSSVVGDASTAHASQGMSAQATVAGGSAKLQKKSFVSVGVRHSDTAGYELRILPAAHKWQYFRDPQGAAPAALVASGTYKPAKAPKTGKTTAAAAPKADTITLQAFAVDATTTSVTASVNGQSVVNTPDTAADQPDGKQTVLATGVKGTGAGTGVRGTFDNVTISVPSPF
jgi:hypothetical protein